MPARGARTDPGRGRSSRPPAVSVDRPAGRLDPVPSGQWRPPTDGPDGHGRARRSHRRAGLHDRARRHRRPTWSTPWSRTWTGSSASCGATPVGQQLRGRPTPCASTTCWPAGRSTQSIPVHPAVLPIVEGVLDPGCLVSSLSSIAIDPGRDGPAHPRRRPADPAAQAPSTGGVQHDVGAHRLHRGQRRHPDGARQPPGRPARPTTASPTTRSRPRWPRAACSIWHGSLWHGGGANTTDRAAPASP